MSETGFCALRWIEIVIYMPTSWMQGHRKRLQRMWRHVTFAAASPFHHSRGQDSGYVLAFEVELQSIVGLDYSNPLILHGRMVMEARRVTKREFLTVHSTALSL